MIDLGSENKDVEEDGPFEIGKYIRIRKERKFLAIITVEEVTRKGLFFYTKNPVRTTEYGHLGS